jgi:hypothetical protein
MWNPLLLILAVLAAALPPVKGAAVGQYPQASPRKTTVCDLAKKPDTWNHVRVQLSAVATHEFESFLLSDPTCGDSQTSTLIWLTYGGRESTGTTYCCPGEGGQSTRPKPLVIEGVSLPLAADGVFRRFRELLSKQPRTAARVSLVGTFFAGEQSATATWGGFGHMGCCSLLVIERVEQFAEVKRPN